MLTHIVLDLDGTLFDMESNEEFMLERISKGLKMDYMVLSEKFYKEMEIISKSKQIFRSSRDFYNTVFDNCLYKLGRGGIEENKNLYEESVSELGKTYVNIKPREGVVEFLRYIKEKTELKVIIFTGGIKSKFKIDKKAFEKSLIK